MDLKSLLKRRWPETAILVAAALLRFILLGMKPPHFDEGVNGWFVDQMAKMGYYHYDPTNYHGPLHFYVLFLAQTLLGRHVWALRLPMVLASLSTIWLALKFERFLGRPAVLWAAAAMALSPGSVFYARYAIHEYWLVLSLMLMAWGLAGLWQSGQKQYLWALWIGLTGAVLTKETYIIHLGCFLLAAPCVWLLEQISPVAKGDRPAAAQEWTWRDMGLGALLFAGCVVFFYSGGFLDGAALSGLYKTFHAWLHTGKKGNGHEKPAYYWLILFGWYEAAASLGLAAAFCSVLPRTPRLVRGLAIYGIGALFAYSLIPYKTPWCIVSLTWPFLLLFGYQVAFLTAKFRRPVFLMAGLTLAASLYLSVRLNYFHYADPKEDYVYVQTLTDVNKLMDPLNEMVKKNAANYQMTGSIVMDSYHPLPWLLGDFTQVGYYGDDLTPHKLDADFLLVEESRIDDVEAELKDEYFTEDLTLRDAQEPSKLYLSVRKFRTLYPTRPADFKPKAATP